ncbi:MAG: hypothetical protein KME30_06700 [Iphinoe sp. HA4291-MV1]|jgi:hypothetical protein|nr:hypothetical protein [Iphinoe sp. HA4291-MV1]
MCIVLDYIQKYPLRTKQILGISYEQYQSLLVSAIARHKELENLTSSGKPRAEPLAPPTCSALFLLIWRMLGTYK